MLTEINNLTECQTLEYKNKSENHIASCEPKICGKNVVVHFSIYLNMINNPSILFQCQIQNRHTHFEAI